MKEIKEIEEKLKTIECDFLLDLSEKTNLNAIKDNLVNIHHGEINTKEITTTEINTREINTKEDEKIKEKEDTKKVKKDIQIAESLIYKSVLFMNILNLNDKHVFKKLDLKIITTFFNSNPPYDYLMKNFIEKLSKDPLIYEKTKTNIFYILLIVLNYLETNNKKSLSIENQISKINQKLSENLKTIKKDYFFNLFEKEKHNKYILYLQPVVTVEMEALFLNYFYSNRLTVGKEFLGRLLFVIKNIDNINKNNAEKEKNNFMNENFKNHRLSKNDNFTKIRRDFMNAEVLEKPILLFKTIFFYNSCLFTSVNEENLIITVLNIFQTILKPKENISLKPLVLDILLEFYLKSKKKEILRRTVKTEIFKNCAKHHKITFLIKKCTSLKEFTDVFKENKNDSSFFKTYLSEIEIFRDEGKLNFTFLLEILLHIEDVIETSSPYFILQERKQIFSVLSASIHKFINQTCFLHSNSNENVDEKDILEKYRQFSNFFSKFLKGLEKNLTEITAEKQKTEIKTDKSVSSFLMAVRPLEDLLKRKFEGFKECDRINRRGFVIR